MGDFRIPVGGEDFDEIRQRGSYYVDKTGLIYELVRNTENKVTLFTRPRRFGKTLNMRMMESFFDIRRDSRAAFDGLEVSRHEEFCQEWMNQFPVLFATLQNIEGLSFEAAVNEMRTTLSNVCHAMPFLEESDKASKEDKITFSRLKAREARPDDLTSSLFTLSRMLHVHFGRKVVLLIDEYDVPLAKAAENGYYREMLDVVRGLFKYALKSNPHLQFAAVTGCLRVAKESIFTGTNNFASYSVLDKDFSEYFGFTQAEVEKMLRAAGREDKAEIVKSWYDGYVFGDHAVYCPWDVVNYVAAAVRNPEAQPKNYWSNTSGNAILDAFAGREDIGGAGDKFEALMNGGVIRQTLSDDLTYDALYGPEGGVDEEALWSVLAMTGYLTKADPNAAGNDVELRIPNREVAELFQKAVARRFRKTLDQTKQKAMTQALWDGDEARASALISDFLWRTISYNNYHEDYYHAFLAGLFTGLGYAVDSDRERGLGRPDLEVRDRDNRRALVLEAKRADSESAMERACEEALSQIARNRYSEDASLDGYETVLCYGIAFFKKKALVRKLAGACGGN